MSKLKQKKEEHSNQKSPQNGKEPAISLISSHDSWYFEETTVTFLMFIHTLYCMIK